MGQNGHGWDLRLKDGPFFLYAVLAYGAIALVITCLAALFLQNVWMIGDTRLFFRMAEVILSGGTPYVDFKDPKPPLIFFTLTVPTMLGQQVYGGLLLAGLCNFLSAIVVMRMGQRLYGRLPGFAAGLIFMVNMALAEGFFILTEPFTLLFILLSAYALLFMDKKYLLSGLFAGIAVGFKQYALLLIPLALFYAYRRGELESVIQFLAGLILPLLAIFGAIFMFYGAGAGVSSLYWSFGVADSYVTSGYLGDIPAYKAEDPLIAMANFALEASLFISLLALALAGLVLDRTVTPREEYFILSGAAFLSVLVIRQYLHYWALALPFIVLLCVRAYRKREARQ
jgi:hypothetical protein